MRRLFLASILSILLYFYNGLFGMFFTSIVFFNIFTSKNIKTIRNKFIYCLIFSIPVSYIGILGMDMHHAFSWYMIVLVLFTIYLFHIFIKERKRIQLTGLLSIIIMFFLLIVSNLNSNNFLVAITEITQMFTVILPIYLYINISKKQDVRADDCIKLLSHVISATSICVIFQYFMYKLSGISLGYITVFNNRITFDLLFKGYSVLSVFIGIGIVINIVAMIKKFNIMVLFKIIVHVIAIIVNSSRTGLYSAVVVTFLIIVSYIINSKKIKISIILTVPLVFVLGILFLMKYSRYNISSFMYDNGRIENLFDGINVLVSSAKNFLLGAGFSKADYGEVMSTHNFIIGTLMNAGVIVSLIIFGFVLYILKKYKHSNCIYICWHILLSSMFITSFFANTFIVPCVLVLIASNTVSIHNNANEHSQTINSYMYKTAYVTNTNIFKAHHYEQK